LKQNTGTRNIPVLVVGTTEDEIKAYDLGVDRYVVRPFDRGLLMGELTSLAGRQTAHGVLIVDDSELDRYLLKQQLRSLSLSIAEEPSGSGGLQRAKSSHPDLIFLDLSIPDMSGFEVLDRLKSTPEVSAIPVIVITSRPLTGRDRERLAQKTIGIFEKNNLDESELLKLIRSNLKVAAAHTRQ
jgi:CheY-like chemotaxis protein